MRSQLFSYSDIIPGLICLLVLIFITHYLKFYKESKGYENKFYLFNFYFKIALATAFALVYTLLYGGGDTFAYFQGSDKLNNLFFDNPLKYANEISDEAAEQYQNFNARTGYPPGWIYREPEGYFISKIISIFMLIGFKSYWAVTFILAFIMANVNYQLFVYVKNQYLLKRSLIAIALLFIPSVSFWCTGISKDTIVFIALILGAVSALKLINKDSKLVSFDLLYFIIAIYLLIEIRTFLLLTLIIPLAFALTTRLLRSLDTKPVYKLLIRFAVILLGVTFSFIYLSQSSVFGELSADKILKEAAVIQQDFSQNKNYGNDRYDLGIDDFSTLGMLKVSPQAIVAGVYRPFPWDSSNIALLINSLESLVLLILSLVFIFKQNLKARLGFLRKNEIFTFALFFVLILAFMTGFSSSIYGVLVRLRAPLLPFAFLLLLGGIYGNHKENKDGTDILNTKRKQG